MRAPASVGASAATGGLLHNQFAAALLLLLLPHWLAELMLDTVKWCFECLHAALTLCLFISLGLGSTHSPMHSRPTSSLTIQLLPAFLSLMLLLW